MKVPWPLNHVGKSGRMDRGRRRGSHRTVEEELAWAASVKKVMDEKGWTQERVARHLNISRAAVSQAVCTAGLDARVRTAMVEKGETGWRARQEDVRRFARQPVNQVLAELCSGRRPKCDDALVGGQPEARGVSCAGIEIRDGQ